MSQSEKGNMLYNIDRNFSLNHFFKLIIIFLNYKIYFKEKKYRYIFQIFQV